MREFLDSILDFIGSESLSDDEFDALTISDPEGQYTLEVYEALRAVIEARENVSDQVERLQHEFAAKGTDVTASDSDVPTPQSNILIGEAL